MSTLKLLKDSVDRKFVIIATPPSSETFFKTQFDVYSDSFSDFYGIPFISTDYTKMLFMMISKSQNSAFPGPAKCVGGPNKRGASVFPKGSPVEKIL